MASLKIPVTKGGGSIEIDLDQVPDNIYQAALAEGFKVFLNRRMSKITVKGLEGAELASAQSAAMAKAQENYADIVAGKFKLGRGAAAGSAKVPAAVMTEARRLARNVVKDEIKAAGLRISNIPASKITELANQLIAADPSYVEKAQKAIDERMAKVAPSDNDSENAAKAKAFLESLGGVAESPELKAKSNAKKAEAKTTLSAKQAGKAAPRKAKGNSPVAETANA